MKRKLAKPVRAWAVWSLGELCEDEDGNLPIYADLSAAHHNSYEEDGDRIARVLITEIPTRRKPRARKA